ncbi:MAG: hypothetical protein CMH50_02895 [Myxococcales bacterium]|nr:hypothetical protein [Myxococcales bacterium]
MPDEPTNWLPGLIALVAGLAIAGILILRPRARREAPTSDLEGRDLESRFEDLITQLKALPKGEEEQEERLLLELEAARVLRQLDTWKEQVPAPTTPVQETKSEMGKTALVFTGAGIATAILLPVMLVIPALSDRQEGGSVTGNDGLVNPPTPGQPRAKANTPAGGEHGNFGDLKKRAAAEPDNVELQLEMAGAYLRIGRFMEVFEASKRVLDRQPDQPQALTFMSAVSLRMGKFSEAEEMMSRVIKQEPQAPEAYLLRGMAQLKLGKGKAALSSFETMAKLDPAAAPSLGSLIRQAKQAAGIDPGPAPPPVAARPPHPSQSPHGSTPGHDHGHPDRGHHAHAPHKHGLGGGKRPGVKVKVILPAALKDQVSSGSVVFVYARAPGVTAGPPLAVKRFPISALPTSFELGDGDMMMGGQLPMVVDLHARIDEDGVATTKTGEEPYAKLNRQRRGGPVGRLVLSPRRGR